MIKLVGGHHGKKVVAIGAVGILLAVAAAGALAAARVQTSQNTPQPSNSASEIAYATASPSESPSESPMDSPTPDALSSPSADPEPTPMPSGWAYSDLDGVAAPTALAHRLPLAVMIDDNAVARPQSGFSSASIVYQAPADGGEDRYMMVFQEGTATDIGPARSARPYYVYWAAEYKALYGHVGGDAKSRLQVIPAMARYIYNMDELNGGSCAYHRISTRSAPHNDYTNSAALLYCAAKRGYPAAYQGLPVRTFVADTPGSELPASQSVAIPYRTGTIGYVFDPSTDSYKRQVGGTFQIDPANGQQVVARNIVVMFQAVTNDLSEPHYVRPVVANVGSGKAIVFKEGKAIPGTWKKTSNTALTRLYASAGKEIPFVRGPIYMQSVPISTAVSYQ